MKNNNNNYLRFIGGALLTVAAVLSARADYQSTVLSQGPVGYWRLNETTQPPTPPVLATNAGSVGVAGNAQYVEAVRGVTPGAIVSQPNNGAVSLLAEVDGNRVRVPYRPEWNTSGPFSFEFWIRPDDTAIAQCVAANVEFIPTTPAVRLGWLLYQGNAALNSGNGWVFRLYNSTGPAGFTGVTVGDTLNPNAWYHIVGTFDGTNIRLYTNGTLAGSAVIAGAFRQNTNSTIPLTFGARADGVSGYFTSMATFDESAYYTNALSAAQVLAHYQAGTNAAPATPYQNVVLSDSPVGYWRYNEPGDVSASNIGSLGSAADGIYQVGTTPGSSGPELSTPNYAVTVPGYGASVSVPALNLNTNTVTISGWVNASGLQKRGAGIIMNHAGTTYSGLAIDLVPNGNNLGLGYVWNNDPNTYGWSPSQDFGFPTLNDSEWTYVALVVRPDSASIFMASTNTPFIGITNPITHINQQFDGATLFGSDQGLTNLSFLGAIDEVAIWKRSLSSGELYTQFASAVDGMSPLVFNDLQGPFDTVAVGDPATFTVDVGGTPPLVYVWSKVGGGTVGVTTNNGSFTIGSAVLGDTGSYEVTVTNSYGVVTSQQYPLLVVNPTQPAITALQGFASRSIYPTGTLHMAVSATGGGLKYQWYRNGTAIPSATASTYHVAGITAANSGSYYVSVTNSVGATNTSIAPVVITVPTVPAGSYEAAVVASGPEAWWRLDEVSGTIMYDAVGRHDGTYTNASGGALPTMGVNGALKTNLNKAAFFTGAGGVGVVPHSPVWNTEPFSVELWVRTTNSTGTGIDVPVSSASADGGWGWAADLGESDWLGVILTSSGYSRSPLFSYPEYQSGIVTGLWTHLVITYDGNTDYAYEYTINGNGAFHTWGFANGLPFNTVAPLIVGSLGSGTASLIYSGNSFIGEVDEVAVYTRVMSQAEIQAHIAARGGIDVTLPAFPVQPLSQTVTVGKTVTFSAELSGFPAPALQWFKGAVAISLATNSSLTLSNVALADAGNYSLRATNIVGTNFSATATLTVLPVTAYANVTNDLVLHLKFDGNVQDSSGRANHGAASTTTAPGYSTGKVGSQAVDLLTTLSGTAFSSASYVDLGTPGDLLFGSGTSFTVGLWVKVPVASTNGDVPFIGTEIGAANNPGWFFGNSYRGGGWQWNLNDGVTTGLTVTNNIGVEGPDASINNGGWHHFIVTVDRAGAVVRSYLDGVLVSSRSIAGLGSVDTTHQVVIGQDPTHTYPEASSMTLDDLGIWRRALSAAEVAQIESAGQAGNSFDTVSPSAVTLTITPVGGNLLIQYPSGTLLQSDTVGAGAVWTPVPGATAPSYTTSPTNAAKFYRVLVQ